MAANSTVSQERLELIYESALRQLRSGRSLETVIINLQVKGLEEDEAQNLAKKAWSKYMEEERRQEIRENYNKPLVSLPINFFKTIGRGLIAWVLSVLSGHLVNPAHLKKRDEERVE